MTDGFELQTIDRVQPPRVEESAWGRQGVACVVLPLGL